MKKELFICLIIIFMIVISDIVLQKYTNSSMNSLNDDLNELKQELKEEETFNKLKLKKIKEAWNKNFKVYTCFLEHDELEKINTQLVAIESGIEIEDKEYVYEEIDKAIFIIDYIESKQMLKLDNIL